MTDEVREKFLGIPTEYSSMATSRFIIMPVPYEQTTTYIKGTGNGPAAILKASQQVELYDEEIDGEAYKSGIHTVPTLQIVSDPQRAAFFSIM